MKRTLMMITLSLFVFNGCAEEEPDGTPSVPSKDDAHDNKADGWDICVYYGFSAGCDLCEEYGWYGDGECDDYLIDLGICQGPDPDCETAETIELDSFRISMGGHCPPDVDCSGFFELHADGTLLVDYVGESVAQQGTLSASDLERAREVLTDPDLVALLDLDEPACVEPMGLHEQMTLTDTNGVEHSNGTTFCDQAPIVAARDLLTSLAEQYLPRFSFVSFRLFRSHGPCPPEMEDCSGYIELQADGTLLHDPIGEALTEPYSATITDQELSDAIAILIDPDLVVLLDLEEAVCLPPTDIHEDMTLTEEGGEEHYNSTTMCSDFPVAAARDLLNGLKDAYFPN